MSESEAERRARIRAGAMRDHPFVGGGPYCQSWGAAQTAGDPTITGMVAMRIQCGWPADTHPEGPR